MFVNSLNVPDSLKGLPWCDISMVFATSILCLLFTQNLLLLTQRIFSLKVENAIAATAEKSTMCVNNVTAPDTLNGVLWYDISMVFATGILSLLFTQKIVLLTQRMFSLKLENVVIAETDEECQYYTSILSRKCARYRVLGFDCEWETIAGGRRPVALLQLATVDGFCVLIRLSKLCESGSPHIPPELKVLLKDQTILKVGVVPADDADNLLKDYGLVVCGCLDLRHLTLRNGRTIRGGLKGLADTILSANMDKSWTIRCSNWESQELSEEQISYAANDAWFALKIFQVLALGKFKLSDCNILDSFRTLWKYLTNDSFIPSYVWDYVEMKFHLRINGYKEGNELLQESSVPCTNVVKQKPNAKLHGRAFCIRQSPLYQNCFMQAPDGAVLCTCDRKKAMWYISKDLGEMISEDPLTVRLKFEPSGRAVGTVGQYYVQAKTNCCVVCGKIDNCIRKNVVPHEYKRHFPSVMKDHVSHDVVLLCLLCHLRSNVYDLALKRQLADLCDAPFCQGRNVKFILKHDKIAVKGAARALLRNEGQIPEDRLQKLRLIVQEYYNTPELTIEIIQEAATMTSHVPNEDYDPHGMKVVQYFSIEDNGGLVKLEQKWREHFLEIMKPKHMPNLWSVTHTRDRLVIRATENRVLPDDLCVAGMKDCVSLLGPSKDRTEH